MKNIHEILEFLHGKKATIVAVVSLVNSYIASRGFIDKDTATLIDSLVLIVAFGADYKTKQLLGTHRK